MVQAVVINTTFTHNMLTMNIKKLFVILFCILFSSAGFLYYANTIQKQNTLSTKQYTTNMNTYRQALNSNDYNTSVQAAQQMLNQAKSKDQEAFAKLALGIGLWTRNEGGDLVLAIKTFKEISTDSTFSTQVRASAVNYLAAIAITHNIEFYNTNFPEPVYQKYLADERGFKSPSTAYFNLLTNAESLNPNSFAEYSLAGNWYAIQLQYNPANKDGQSLAIQKIKDLIDQADKRNDIPSQADIQRAQAKFYRAVAVETLATRGVLPVQKAEDAYEDALTASNIVDLKGNSLAINIQLKTRFYYAAFTLQQNQKDTDRIKTLLKPFATVNTKDSYAINYFPYLKNKAPKELATKSALSKLAAISTDFSDFLAKI